MNQGFLPVFESLESRRLLSATINPSPIITADLEAIKADIVKLNADRKQVATTLAADWDAVKAAQKAVDQAVAPLRAALAAGCGFGADVALEALTAGAARLLGVEQEIGRLEPGLKADLVIWSDHPFAPGARVEQVYIDGREVYRADGKAEESDE